MAFWVQRLATYRMSRVLINPTALIGACEIDKIAKFLLPLQCKNCIGSIKELLCVLDHIKFPVRIVSLASSFFITTHQKSGVAK